MTHGASFNPSCSQQSVNQQSMFVNMQDQTQCQIPQLQLHVPTTQAAAKSSSDVGFTNTTEDNSYATMASVVSNTTLANAPAVVAEVGGLQSRLVKPDMNQHKENRHCIKDLIGSEIAIKAGELTAKSDTGETSSQEKSTTLTYSKMITMPSTTWITTTAVTASMLQAGSSMMTAVTGTVSATRIVSSDTRNPEPEHDGKRKTPGESDRSDGNVTKKRNMGEDLENLNTDEMLKQMFSEVIGIRSTMSDVNKKLETMQKESSMWSTKFQAVKKDVSDVKDSVEMAHNFINDEKVAREKNITELKRELGDRAQEIHSNVQLIKTHSKEAKDLKSSLKDLQQQVGNVNKQRDGWKQPVESLKNRLDDLTPESSEFPVGKTLMAQRVWYRESEVLDKVAKLLFIRL